MIEDAKLTSTELENLHKAMEQLENDLSTGESQNYLFSNPIGFFKKYNIKIMTYIRRNKSLSFQLRQGVRELLQGSDITMQKCFISKLTVLLLLFGTLGKFGSKWGVMKTLREYIVYNSNHYFGINNDNIIADCYAKNARPSEIALSVCKRLGYCS